MVPTPNVLPILQPGASNIARFLGPLPNLTAGQPLRVDLKCFALSIRASENLRQNMRVTLESGAATLVGPTPTTQPSGNSEVIAFFDQPDQPNEYLEISGLTFDTGTEQFILQIENVQSIIR